METFSDLSRLTNEDLLIQTQNAVSKEREATTLVLHHLREVERRMLFATLGLSSLFDYAVKILGYSESAASRRLSAMKLIQEIPEVAKAIEAGTLSLSNAANCQTFFRREKREQGKEYSIEEKQDILKSMEMKSRREAEKILVSLSPISAVPKEKLRLISETQSELRVVLPESVMMKLEKIKNLWAHKNPDGSMAKLIELMAEELVDRIDPMKKEERANARQQKKQQQSQEVVATSAGENQLGPQAGIEKNQSKNPRFVSAKVSREIYIRDEGRCSYVDPETGRRCEGQFGLQIDHVIPVFAGGRIHCADDGRLLCRSHNVHAIYQKLGSHMEKYVPSLRK